MHNSSEIDMCPSQHRESGIEHSKKRSKPSHAADQQLQDQPGQEARLAAECEYKEEEADSNHIRGCEASRVVRKLV